MQSKTATNFYSNNNRRKLKPIANASILTAMDYERIRRNARLDSLEEANNIKRIETEQKYAHEGKARELKERIINFDRTHTNRFYLSEVAKQDMEKNNALLKKAKEQLDSKEDAVADMNKLALYAKVASIRDRQVNEHQQMNDLYKRKEEKLDIMMEIERLKELRKQQDREKARKDLQREGCLTIIDQIKDREQQKLKLKDAIEKERLLIARQIKEMQDEDKRILEKKRIENERMAKDLVAANKISALSKEKKKIEEKEENLKILKYNMEKARKEEMELMEKKRIKEEKERETQKLREKQEKAQDKQAALDALRAQRHLEETERITREKEKQEIILRQKKVEELIAANERQKQDKILKLAQLAQQEKDEQERIVMKQIADMEKDRLIEEEKQRMRNANRDCLKQQIKLKEEKILTEQREVLEEGRKMRQKGDDYYERMERIRQQKIQELKDLNIDPKYIVDLEKYKIV